MKKIVSALLYFLFCSHAYATTGIYVGGDVGVDYNGWYVKDNVDKKISFASHGLLGRLALGVGLGEEFYYLGGEIFGEYASNKTHWRNLNNANTQRRIKRTSSIGAAVMPGIKLQGALLYGRLGYVKTHFHIEDILLNPITETPFQQGYQLGIGTQTATNENVDMRIEFLYYKYHSFTNINGSFYPHDLTLTVGFIYRLC